MFTSKRNVLSLFLIIFFILVSVIPCNADAGLKKEISTMKELKKEIKKHHWWEKSTNTKRSERIDEDN